MRKLRGRSYTICRSSTSSTAYLSYEDAKTVVRELGIKSYTQYNKLFRAGKLPKELPSHPSSFYAKPRKLRISYIQAKKLAKDNNINNSTEWRTFALKYNENDKNDFLPLTGASWKEWIDWFDFLDKKLPPLSELKSFAKKHNIKTGQQWYDLEKPQNYVKCPDSSPEYKKEWEGWDWFLDKEMVTYNEGKQIVKKLKIKSYLEYGKLGKSGKLPKGMPLDPYKFKAWEKEWEGWSNFLAYFIQPYNFLEFNEAKKFLKPYNVKTIKQFLKLRRTNSEIREKIPINPYHYYKEWKDWGDFIGNGKIPRKDRKYLPYQQTQKYLQKLGILSRDEFYEKWQKLKLTEKGIPIDPERIYKKTGEWEGYTKLFGKTHNQGNFLSYEEASRKLQEMKIERAEDYLKLAIAHKLPKGMPRKPISFYKKEWKGWYHFLGKEKPLNYEEASKVVQKLGITSKEQYNEYYDSGKLPKGMPKKPNEAYQRKGWYD